MIVNLSRDRDLLLFPLVVVRAHKKFIRCNHYPCSEVAIQIVVVGICKSNLFDLLELGRGKILDED